MKDKTKIRVLCIIIGFIILVMGLLFLIVFLSIKEENATGGKLKQTTRRSISTTITTTMNIPETSTSVIIENDEPTSMTTTTTKRAGSTKTTTSTKTTKTTTSTKTSKMTTTTKANNRHIVTNASTYPNALDAWEWQIVNLINEERGRNGLKSLAVAEDLRDIAEKGADDWINLSQEELKRVLYGHSYYAKKSNGLNATTGYETLYENVLSKTSITTNEGLKYLGVGIIYKENGENGIPSHYFVIIYE